nr:hypothetical protein [Streptomyces taklimakanensis]
MVPMWLRRQDELNEARPTERFGTAIRLLSGRAAMERRYARSLKGSDGFDGLGERGQADGDDPVAPDGVDVRALANPATERHTVPGPATMARSEAPTEIRHPLSPTRADHFAARAGRADHEERTGNKRRAKLLARRRRTTMVLFLAFTLGAVVAAVGGVAFLWAPAIPAGLLSAYIAHMRAQERRRFEFVMDQRRAEAAARRLRERRAAPAGASSPAPASASSASSASSAPKAPAPPAEARPEPAPGPEDTERRALVEQTDHAEWVDAQRRERAPAQSGWEPTPVPLPTYVNAPVAPRTAGGVDLGAPDAWSSARSTTAATPSPSAASSSAATPSPSSAGPAPRRQTPLFDQYADEDRPRAANE